jgi:NAD(P)-dependent dehydrogenase (short-subunit alcohol dehydrogenase family)
MPPPSALVTGASTGIGRATVDELVGAGFRVFATVRTEADDAALREAHPDAVTVLQLDVTDPAAIASAGAAVRAAGPLNGLVNNAGVALPAPLEYVPIDVFRRQLEVNLVGQLAVTQAMLPALRDARADGAPARLVFVGSIGGRIAGPMIGPYHASKFGLVGLTDALRAELAPWQLPVVLVEPGAVATPIWQRGRDAGEAIVEQLGEEARRRYGRQLDGMRANAARSAERGVPPAEVAQVIREALTSPRPHARYLVGREARIGAVLARVSFRATRRLTAARRNS